MEGNINPYELLEVPKDFSLDQLKQSYKRIAMKVHPDKGGNEYMFNLVTVCFKALMKEYKRRISDKQHNELKQAFQKLSVSQPKQAFMNERFDINKFNKIFNENKLDDVTDSGYDEWYKNEKTKEPPKFRGGSREAFNQHFEKHSVKVAPSKHVIKYEEPEAYWKSKLPCTELGVSSVSDFSGDNTSLKRLNFTDLKLAHSTSRIVDPSTVQRDEYNSIDDIKRARGNIQYSMDDATKEKYEKKLRLQEEHERKRLVTQQERDHIIQEHYNKMHNLLKGTMMRTE